MSTREESYSGYPLWIVPLTGGDAPEPDGHPNAVRIYADENQDLRTIKSDGTDAPIGGGGGDEVISVASVKLTNAQVLALPSTPVQVVAAPGVGKVLIPFLAVFFLDWTADYTNIDPNATLGTYYASLGHPSMLASFVETTVNDVSGVLAEGASNYAQLGPIGRVRALSATVDGIAGSNDEPGQTNAPLVVGSYNAAAGNFTGGDPANTLQVTVYYNTLTLI